MYINIILTYVLKDKHWILIYLFIQFNGLLKSYYIV